MNAIVLVYAVLVVAYGIFIAVAIWRSADNYRGSAWWSGLSKVAVVLSLLRFVGELLKGLSEGVGR